jgi:CYTH domain-containing protein
MSKEIEQKYLIPDSYNIPNVSNKHIRQAHLWDNENLETLIWKISTRICKVFDVQWNITTEQRKKYIDFLDHISTVMQDYFHKQEWKFIEYKIRVRITNKNKAELTCKWKQESWDTWIKQNEEFNMAIPVEYAYFLLTQVSKAWDDPIEKMWKEIRWVTKRRYKVVWEDQKIWDVDKYLGSNRWIQTADIELDSIDEKINPIMKNMVPLDEKPKRYKNKKLQIHPYREWSQSEKETHRTLSSSK